MGNRRGFLGQFASLTTGLFVGRSTLAGQQDPHAGHTMPASQTPTADPHAQHIQGGDSQAEVLGNAVLIETPDLPKLGFSLVDGFKEFHLMAQPVETEFIPAKSSRRGVTTEACRAPRSK